MTPDPNLPNLLLDLLRQHTDDDTHRFDVLNAKVDAMHAENRNRVSSMHSENTAQLAVIGVDVKSLLESRAYWRGARTVIATVGGAVGALVMAVVGWLLK